MAMVIFAYAGTAGKTDVEIRIHINEQLVFESEFGESPTFAIWFEEQESGKLNTVFVTRRAAEGDWEGKQDVPTALPAWFENERNGAFDSSGSTGKKKNIDATTGATPVPGYFICRVRVHPGSEWIVWIEMNLAGDYNEFYPAYDENMQLQDEYMSGQPAVLYRTVIKAEQGKSGNTELTGISLVDKEKGAIVSPPEGLTTAPDVFDEISIRMVRPKPRLLKRKTLKL